MTGALEELLLIQGEGARYDAYERDEAGYLVFWRDPRILSVRTAGSPTTDPVTFWVDIREWENHALLTLETLLQRHRIPVQYALGKPPTPAALFEDPRAFVHLNRTKAVDAEGGGLAARNLEVDWYQIMSNWPVPQEEARDRAYVAAIRQMEDPKNKGIDIAVPTELDLLPAEEVEEIPSALIPQEIVGDPEPLGN
jgi:hypothetical protein